jgi:FAD/FMN-containing dehydrogenase
LWKLRESVPEAQRAEGASIKHDVSVPVAALPRFMAEATAAVLSRVPAGRLVAYGHVGDGNLHFNVSVPLGGDDREFLAHATAIHDAVYDIVRRFRGSISAEHGIGRLKREALARHRSPVDLEVMRAIKHAFDPKGILNPGKLLPDPDVGRPG